MARKLKNPAPKNKNAGPAPENKDNGLLESLVEVEDQLDRLLKAEGRYWIGEIGRADLHRIAEGIRKERAEGEVGDE
ncbi:MAG: hypothetical protein D6698_01825 [Gammaproteobacteria bacterium]|nr:MAG: hypothetical protein D6698_01825 [Gammaproteobacteria bacterium]